MPCEILDLRCILMNELVGSAFLTMIFLTVLFFIATSKLKLGFEATLALAIPVLLITSLAISGFSAIYAFTTVIVGIGLGWVIQKVIKN